jgi:hypothetical protein
MPALADTASIIEKEEGTDHETTLPVRSISDCLDDGGVQERQWDVSHSTDRIYFHVRF